MRFLIDGYNLLHALGLITRDMPPGGLERGRDRLVDWIASKHPRPADVCVVFDAREVKDGDDSERFAKSVRVRYAVGREADDMIEDLIREEQKPARLTIVSNDRRLQVAGRRGGCRVWDCGELIDWLEAGAPSPNSARPDDPIPEKPDQVAEDELEFWLREFGER